MTKVLSLATSQQCHLKQKSHISWPRINMLAWQTICPEFSGVEVWAKADVTMVDVLDGETLSSFASWKPHRWGEKEAEYKLKQTEYTNCNANCRPCNWGSTQCPRTPTRHGCRLILENMLWWVRESWIWLASRAAAANEMEAWRLTMRIDGNAAPYEELQKSSKK